MEEQTPKWPRAVAFSMAPFGYVVGVTKVLDHDLTVEYRCDKCPFQVGFDKESGTYASFREIFRKHVDDAH